MHDLVGQYAATLGERHAGIDQRDQDLRRLLHYIGTARAADARLDPTVTDPLPNGQGDGFATREQSPAWLDAELPNLMAAAHTAAANGHPAIANSLALVPARLLGRRRLFNDWLTLATLARDTATRAADRASEGQALGNLGLVLLQVGRFGDAIACRGRGA
ncbi:hypothetical protein [Actinomadura sp. NEAU-AAG7]|uniref:hypothetical protein n=1 Tax=Actinomadura sp. NEAU-AAG7 TaxID=2839640 RepID=UPI001BE41FFA|nr:hypothetical protein [Actinomadura sp. NEAU-AAG7]MBT2211801.1 hypothetical protein [Actinomadura sp. NEAU-AAG7]